MGAEPGDESEGAHLEGAAEALVLLAEPVDLIDHRLLGGLVEAADGALVDALEGLGPEVVGRRRLDRGDPGDVAEDADAELGQELAGEAAGGNAGGGLSGAGALEDVADVVAACT